MHLHKLIWITQLKRELLRSLFIIPFCNKFKNDMHKMNVNFLTYRYVTRSKIDQKRLIIKINVEAVLKLQCWSFLKVMFSTPHRKWYLHFKFQKHGKIFPKVLLKIKWLNINVLCRFEVKKTKKTILINRVKIRGTIFFEHLS